MSLPIGEIRDVLNSSVTTQEAMAEEVRVAIFVHDKASDDVVQTIQRAFMPNLSTGLIHVEEFGEDKDTIINVHTNLSLIIPGPDRSVGSLFNTLNEDHIPTVVIGRDAKNIQAWAQNGGHHVPNDNIVASSENSEILSRLSNWILDHVDKKLHLALAANFGFLRHEKADRIVSDTSKQNALIGGVVVIPGADMPLMTANQIKMILQLAALYGKKIGLERAKELAVTVGGGFAFRAIARQTVGIVPGLGWAIKGGIGYAGTLAMGKAAIEYFEKDYSVDEVAQKVVEVRDRIFKEKLESSKSEKKESTFQKFSKKMKNKSFSKNKKDAPESKEIYEEPVHIEVQPPLLESSE